MVKLSNAPLSTYFGNVKLTGPRDPRRISGCPAQSLLAPCVPYLGQQPMNPYGRFLLVGPLHVSGCSTWMTPLLRPPPSATTVTISSRGDLRPRTQIVPGSSLCCIQTMPTRTITVRNTTLQFFIILVPARRAA